MPADVAIKAIKDLTNVLKGEKGEQRDDEFEALVRLERLVINKLTVDPEKRDANDEATPQHPHQPPRVRELPQEPQLSTHDQMLQ